MSTTGSRRSHTKRFMPGRLVSLLSPVGRAAMWKISGGCGVGSLSLEKLATGRPSGPVISSVHLALRVRRQAVEERRAVGRVFGEAGAPAPEHGHRGAVGVARREQVRRARARRAASACSGVTSSRIQKLRPCVETTRSSAWTREVGDRHLREVQLQALPARAVVERDVQPALRAGVEEAPAVADPRGRRAWACRGDAVAARRSGASRSCRSRR